jgi:hypothetical protein
MHYRNDRVTSTQLEQARQIVGSSLFTEAERRRWLLEIGSEDRFGARDMLARLAAEYRTRVKAQQEREAA